MELDYRIDVTKVLEERLLKSYYLIESLVLQDESILEIGCTALGMYLLPNSKKIIKMEKIVF